MRQYPAFLSLQNRDCLVVGAGSNAQWRARALIRAGALVTMVSTETKPQLEGLHQYLERSFQQDDPADYWLVIAATGDEDLNAEVTKACETYRTFCHEVNNQEASSFALPAIIDRSPLLIALSSGGAAPALVLNLKRKLDRLIPAAFAQMAELLEHHQDRIEKLIPKQKERAKFWRPLLDAPLALPTASNTAAHFEHVLENAINTYDPNAEKNSGNGFVSLVGSGPGDPDLLTLRALQLIQSADVIVYDRLVSKSIVEMRRKDAQLLYAGKAKSEHTMAQVSINQLLVDLALEGHRVVRLKGGDPFIFGRGGEEIETLAKHNIPFQVVPGITAASGCAAFTGIPLTHRDHAQSCVFVTGHLKNGEINLNWQDLRDPTQTIVIYMGLSGLNQICEKLISVGRSNVTPAALVEQGTTPNQRVHISTLGELPEVVKKSNVRAPTLLIIGNVVSLHQSLRWFQPEQASTDSSSSHFSE